MYLNSCNNISTRRPATIRSAFSLLLQLAEDLLINSIYKDGFCDLSWKFFSQGEKKKNSSRSS